MFGTVKKNVTQLGIVEADDDRDIEVQHVRKETRRGLFADVGYFVRDIVFALALAILFGVFVIQPVAVEGTSMLPQLHDGERLLVNKLIYYKSSYLQAFGFPKVERGDVVELGVELADAEDGVLLDLAVLVVGVVAVDDFLVGGDGVLGADGVDLVGRVVQRLELVGLVLLALLQLVLAHCLAAGLVEDGRQLLGGGVQPERGEMTPQLLVAGRGGRSQRQILAARSGDGGHVRVFLPLAAVA